MTPEGKIKTRITALLRTYSNVYWFMPVQSGMGAAGLDYHCVARVRGVAVAFFVEAKASFDEEPTDRQDALISKLVKLNAEVFVVCNEVTLKVLERYLDRLQKLDREYQDELYGS